MLYFYCTARQYPNICQTCCKNIRDNTIICDYCFSYFNRWHQRYIRLIRSQMVAKL